MDQIEVASLIRGVTSNVNDYIGNVVGEHGMGFGQFEYFLLIYAKPGIRQLELARVKRVGKPSVTKALALLERRGFVRRERDRDDRRNTRCYVSEEGTTIASELIEHSRRIANTLFAGFSEREQTEFVGYLLRLHENSRALSQTAPRDSE